MPRPQPPPFVQFRFRREWSRIEFPRAPDATAQEAAKLEVRFKRIRRLWFDAVVLDSKPSAAVVIADIGPITMLRRRGERQHQRDNLTLLENGVAVFQCKRESHVAGGRSR